MGGLIQPCMPCSQCRDCRHYGYNPDSRDYRDSCDDRFDWDYDRKIFEAAGKTGGCETWDLYNDGTYPGRCRNFERK